MAFSARSKEAINLATGESVLGAFCRGKFLFLITCDKAAVPKLSVTEESLNGISSKSHRWYSQQRITRIKTGPRYMFNIIHIMLKS